jgi:hypothetical protein
MEATLGREALLKCTRCNKLVPYNTAIHAYGKAGLALCLRGYAMITEGRDV